MAETIESFVAKLQAEGVQAGQEAAEKLRAEAQQQAEQIVQQANKESEKILDDARQEAEKLLAKSKSELQLAARDTILRLREALERALQAVLTHGTEQNLNDPEFLSHLLHDLVVTYAKADIQRDSGILINMRNDLRDKLLDWALREIAQKAQANGLSVDLKGTLKEAGFEYKISRAKVEVTLSSVVETLSEMVSPKLRELVDQAANKEGLSRSTENPQDSEAQ